MAIYKYTLFKYVKSMSTWIIALVSSVLIAFILGTILPFTLLNLESPNITTDYITTAIALTAGITSFLAIFTSVFAGFKGATMFKDEVEDGTFLVILSKPMRRSKIILMKWLALQTLLAIYTFTTVLFFVIGILIFDKGSQIPFLEQLGVKTLASQIFIIGLFTWLILFVMGLIFSSIALLLSTKLSVGSTIGISIAIGVFIPITSLIGIFVKREEYRNFNNSSYALISQELKNTTKNNSLISSVLPTLSDKLNGIIDDFQTLIQDPQSLIYNVAGKTGDTDGYKWGWILDFNFQITTLSSFAYEQAIPNSAKELVTSLRSAQTTPGVSSTTWDAVFNKSASSQEFFNQLQRILTDFEPIREMLAFSSLESQFNKIALDKITFNRDDAAKLSYIFNEFAPTLADESKIPLALMALRNQLKIAENLSSIDKVEIDAKNVRALFNYFYTFDFGSIINNPNNDAIYHLANRKKFEDLIYLDDLSYSSSQLGNNWLLARLYNVKEEVLNVMKNNIVNKDINLLKYFDAFKAIVNGVDNPIGNYFVNLRRVDEYIKEQTIPTSAIIESYEQDYLNNSAILGPKAIHHLASSDELLAKSLLSIANADKLFKVEAQTYVSKYVVLFVYIGIALILVPISYLVVRRQDFR